MKARALAFAFYFCITSSVVFAQSYDHHTVFDNSLPSGSLYGSHASFVALSHLEAVDGKLPVEDAHFISPPNGLKLQWQSASGGDWHVSLDVHPGYAKEEWQGDSLYFWCYSDTELTRESSPRISLEDSERVGTPAILLIGDLQKIPAKKWVRVRLPFDSFASLVKYTSDRNFQPGKLNRISIFQGLDDNQPHTLYIDEITVDNTPSSSSVPAAPTGLAAKGYDRHIELTWTREPDLAVRYYSSTNRSTGMTSRRSVFRRTT